MENSKTALTESAKAKLDAFVQQHRSESGQWMTTDEHSLESLQAEYRRLRQCVISEQQDQTITELTTKLQRTNDEQQLLLKLAPLVRRRKFLTNPARPEQLAKFKSMFGGNDIKPDGELFQFEQPTEIKTILKLCGCGLFTEHPSEMTSTQIILADEHIDHCPTPITEEVISQSQPAKHSIGNWGCKACLRIGDGSMTGRSAIDWCPRFLRPFRYLSPYEYVVAVRNEISCYAGLLHVQLSIVEENGETKSLISKHCDTCGYVESQTQLT